MVDKAKLEAYWNENKKLTWIVMIIWFIITYVASFFSAELNNTRLSVSLRLLHGCSGSRDIRGAHIRLRIQDRTSSTGNTAEEEEEE